MHMEKTEDLIAEFNKTDGVQGKGKLRQKIKNELVKRKTVVFVEKELETNII